MCEAGEAARSRTMEEEGGAIVTVELRPARREGYGGGCPAKAEAYITTEGRWPDGRASSSTRPFGSRKVAETVFDAL